MAINKPLLFSGLLFMSAPISPEIIGWLVLLGMVMHVIGCAFVVLSIKSTPSPQPDPEAR